MAEPHRLPTSSNRIAVYPRASIVLLKQPANRFRRGGVVARSGVLAVLVPSTTSIVLAVLPTAVDRVLHRGLSV